jgi:hypothetical protein
MNCSYRLKIADGGFSSAMLGEYSVATMLRNPKLVGLLDAGFSPWEHSGLPLAILLDEAYLCVIRLCGIFSSGPQHNLSHIRAEVFELRRKL